MTEIEIPEGFSPPGAAESPYTMRLPVTWGQMDALQHVNNTQYLRWFEDVRFAYFELIGLNALHAEAHQGPILARTTCDFRAPVTYPDEILASTYTQRIGTKSFTLYNRIWSLRQQCVVAEGEAIIVMMQYGGPEGPKSIKIPEVVRTAILAIDGDRLGV